MRRFWLVLLMLSVTGGVAHAQGRTISGKVQEAVTREPVAGATVLVTGTDIGAITDIDGTFTIDGVPSGEVRLQVSGLSYKDQAITVAPDQEQVDVTMELARSEEILIVGRAPQITRQNLANGASVVKGEEVNQVSSQTIDGALQGRISGANIQSNSGAPGGGIQIKLRGVSTVNGESSPLFVVDGVIVSNEAIPSGIVAVTESAGGSNAAVQDNPVNRIADLNPNDIESIEVLKGPAAAALYGSKATNGVIIITTKRGRPGESRVNVLQRFGTYTLSNKLGSRRYRSAEEVADRFGAEAVAYFEPGVTYDHEEALAGREGLASETSVSLSGGTEATTYYASLMARNDPGIIHNTGYEKQSMRLNLSHDLSERLKVATTANLVHSDTARGVTNNDNAGISHYMTLAFTPSFWDPRPTNGVYPSNPFIGSNNNALQTATLMSDSEEVWRLIGSVSANYRAWETEAQSINLGANVGVDRFQQRNRLLFPPELHFTPSDLAEGIALDASSEARNINAGLSAVYNLRPAGGGFASATTMGFQYEDRELASLYIVARNLTAGQPGVDAGVQNQIGDRLVRIRDRGMHLQQELRLLDDRLTLLGAALAEQSSVNGNVNRFYFYPKAATTYRVPVPEDMLELLRARLAYGETGNKPQYGYKFTPLDASSNIEGVGGIGIFDTDGNPDVGTYGSDDIEPERQREIEAGVDVVGLDGRAIAEVTVYQRTIEDFILDQRVAPSQGYTFKRVNDGTLRNRGVELMLQATPVKSGPLSWLSRAVFSLNRSRVTRMNVPAYIVGGFGTSLGAFRLEPGASATQIVGTATDANGDLLVDGDGNPIVRKLGDAEPTFRVSFVNNITYGDFELSSLLDWQQGSQIINLTKLIYDDAANSADYDDGGRERFMRWIAGNAAEYIEDATFLKLREVSLSYKLPGAWLRQVGPMETARVSVSGRNLLTFTTYSGLDPEVSNFGSRTIFRNIDVAPYPPSRSFWVSVEAGF